MVDDRTRITMNILDPPTVNYDTVLSGGITLIYGFMVDDRTRITMNILDPPTVNYDTVLYVNQGPFSPD